MLLSCGTDEILNNVNNMPEKLNWLTYIHDNNNDSTIFKPSVLSILIIIFLTLVILKGNNISTSFNSVFTILNIVMLIFLIIYGSFYIKISYLTPL